MANYSIARSKHATLVAATADAVTLTKNYTQVEILNRSTSGDIYATVDGTAPVSAADNTFFIGPGQALLLALPNAGAGTDSDAASDVVKLISAGTPSYSVTGV